MNVQRVAAICDVNKQKDTSRLSETFTRLAGLALEKINLSSAI